MASGQVAVAIIGSGEVGRGWASLCVAAVGCCYEYKLYKWGRIFAGSMA